MKEVQVVKALLSGVPDSVGPAAARILGAHLPQPVVIRLSQDCQPRVRAWSSRPYRAVGPLFLDEAGRFFQRFRADWKVGAAVEVRFRFVPIDQPPEADLRTVLAAAFPLFRDQAYSNWSRLSDAERLRLVSLGGSWQEAAAAMADSGPAEQLSTLGCLLGAQADPGARHDTVCACLRGDLKLPPEALPWLLSQPLWNQSPGHVELARTLTERHPELLDRLRDHPNLRVRLRAVELLKGVNAMLSWLAGEPHETVRARLVRLLETCTTAFDLVERLVKEQEPRMRDAIGWALVHWSSPNSSRRDWSALNHALRAGLGRENRSLLKRRLSRLGKLQLANRFLA